MGRRALVQTRRRFLRAGVVSGAACLAGCGMGGDGQPTESPTDGARGEQQPAAGTEAQSASGDWPRIPAGDADTWSHNTRDPQNTLANTGMASRSGEPSVEWTVEVEFENPGANNTFADPIVADGTVYLFTHDFVAEQSLLRTFDAETGEERRRRELSTGDVFNGTLYAVHGGTLVASFRIDDVTVLEALDAASLEPRWEREFEATISPHPTDESVFVGTSAFDGGGEISALDPATGETRWTSQTDYGIWGLAADGTAVFAGTSDNIFDNDRGALLALDDATGETVWAQRRGDYQNLPVVVGDTVYAVDKPNTLQAFDARTGELRWSEGFGESSPTPPAVAGDGVFVSNAEDAVIALDAEDGAEQWRFETEGDFYPWTTPRLTRDAVYVGVEDTTYDDGNARLYSLEPATGDVRWVREGGDLVLITALVGGFAYTSSTNGVVQALAV